MEFRTSQHTNPYYIYYDDLVSCSMKFRLHFSSSMENMWWFYYLISNWDFNDLVTGFEAICPQKSVHVGTSVKQSPWNFYIHHFFTLLGGPSPLLHHLRLFWSSMAQKGRPSRVAWFSESRRSWWAALLHPCELKSGGGGARRVVMWERII